MEQRILCAIFLINREPFSLTCQEHYFFALCYAYNLRNDGSRLQCAVTILLAALPEMHYALCIQP